MEEERAHRAFISRLQPGRNSLLINGEWGTPLSQLTEDKAREGGLVKWKHRWVTRQELRQLKVEHRAYTRIWLVAAIILCIGLCVLVRAVEFVSSPQAFRSAAAEAVEVGSKFLYPVFHLVVAWGIARYRNWARWVAVVLYPLLIPPRTFYDFQVDEIFRWRMIVLGFFVLILVTFFSKAGRTIFTQSGLRQADPPEPAPRE